MNSKRVFSGILLLSVLTFSIMTAASATTYTIGVKTGDSYTWEIKALDPSYTGAGGAKVGDRETMSITSVDETTTEWSIAYSLTAYNGASSSGTGTVPKDPASWSFIYICALPVSDYLTGAYGSSHVSGNKVTFTGMTVIIEMTYDTSTGVMSDMKYTVNGKVIFEIALVTTIPGYELTIFLGVSAISALSLIYLVMKKK